MLDSDFARAWAIADAVLAARDPATRDDPACAYHERWVWDGRRMRGQAVVVRCYHGLGDTLQFVRYLPALRDQAAHVTLEVQAELAPLLAGSADRVVAFDPADPIRADLDIEIMELQHALRLPPAATPYLRAVATPVPNATLGVCWQAGGWDADRSIPLALLQPALPAGAISLQRGQAGLPDPLGGSMDVGATAALIASLERVVTVDTMVAHLAGALGRPVELLLKVDADWRWGRAARTSWYANTRIHRQHRPGDWSAPIASLTHALSA